MNIHYKMSTHRKTHKSKKAVAQDCTPVKSTKIHNVDACKLSPLVTNLAGNGSKESSPDVQYSPVIKPSQSDIEWAWKSPIGRIANAGQSGAVTKRRLLNKTPLQKTKRQSKSNSPLNNIHLKRKLIKLDKMEEDHHLSHLTSQWQALTEIQSITLKENKESIKEGPNNNADLDVGSTAVDANSSASVTTCAAKSDSFSTLMDDDDDCFALLCCSQVLEAKLIDNPNKVVFSPILLNSSKSSSPTDEHSTTPKWSKSTPVSKHSQNDNDARGEHRPKLANTVPKLHTTDSNSLSSNSLQCSTNTNNTPSVSSKCKSSNNTMISACKPVPIQATYMKKLAKSQCNITDLLNHKVKEPKKPPLSNSEIKCSEIQSNPSNLGSSEIRDISSESSTTISSQGLSTTTRPNKSSSAEDDFIQPDLLDLLEKIESTSAPRGPSPTFRCTPEEIEKKRRLAKVKLEQKRMAMLGGINRLPNPMNRRESK